MKALKMTFKEKKPRGKGKPFRKGDPRAGRPKGALNKATLEGREFARGILGSEEYREWLEARVADKSLAPQLEVMLWHYGFGKPKETHEHEFPNGLPPISVIERVILREPTPED